MTESNTGLPGVNPRIERRESKEYPREFFDLQIKFAKKLSEVSGQPISDTLLNGTNLYKRLGLEGKPNSDNPLWQQYISGFEGSDPTGYTYQVYLNSKDQRIKKDSERLTFGCFRYDYEPADQTVRIHFGNRTESGSPLDDPEKRRQELRQMFEYIKKNHPDAKQVKGGSWLYNVPKYKNIFPPEYTATSAPYDSGYQGFSIWGQFLDRNNNVRKEKAEEFLESLSKAKNQEEVLHAFPDRPLSAGTGIENFYKFLGLN
jgi:hypothetical protein